MTYNNSINAPYLVETGAFSPGLAFGGGTTGIAYTTQNGNYIKIGRLVIAWCVVITSSKGSSVGVATMTGLPFTVSNSTFSGNGIVAQSGLTLTANFTYVTARGTLNGVTAGIFQCSNTGATSTQLDDTHFAAGTNSLRLTLVYLAAS